MSDKKLIYKCHSTNIRWCITSEIEFRKCEALKLVSEAIGIEPKFECVIKNNRKSCLKAVENGISDLFISKTDENLLIKK